MLVNDKGTERSAERVRKDTLIRQRKCRWGLGEEEKQRETQKRKIKTWRQGCSAHLVKPWTSRLAFRAAALSTEGFSAKQKTMSSQGG